MKTIAILFFLMCLTAFGASKKTTDYPPITNAGPNDLLLLSEFTGGVTNSKSISLTNLNNSLLALPSSRITNTQTGVTLDGTFSGNGAGLTSLSGVILSDTGKGTNTTLSQGIIFDFLTFGSGIYFTNTAEALKWTLTGSGTNAIATLGQVSNIVAAATNGLSGGGGGDTLTNIAGSFIHVSTNGGYRVFTATNTYQSGLFGDGSDGHLNFDGVTTPVGGATLAGTNYTVSRTIYASGIFITNTVGLIVNGRRMYCSGIMTNFGTIYAYSGPGLNGLSTGTNGLYGSTGASSEIGAGTIGGAGGNGQTSSGSAGSASANANFSTGGYGSKGGKGGNGSSGTGGNGGAIGAAAGFLFRLAPVYSLITGVTVLQGGSGGGGGGGGSGDGVVFGGGGAGGGAGGGILGIWAWGITNNGTISANGGPGGNGGSPASGNAGGGAGGGGGGGGFVYANGAYFSGSGTWTATGGVRGLGGTNSGTGTIGAPGTNGADGLVIRYNLTTMLFE